MISATAEGVLLHPLSLFRQASGESLPPFEVIEGSAVPAPYRDLLVHRGDMTSRLQAFHEGRLELDVLHCSQTPEFYRREVILRLVGSGLAVEYGAIEIALAAFPAPLRAEIVEARSPLGGILNAHDFRYLSRPKAFIRLGADEIMAHVFGVTAEAYYGRCNELLSEEGTVLARIVEVLRP